MKALTLLILMVCFVIGMTTAHYHFNRDSCRTLLPTVNQTDDDEDFYPEMQSSHQAGHDDTSEEQDDDDDDRYGEYAGVLLPADERSPHRISVSTLNYRRNRVQTVKIEGPEFNGLMIHATRRFASSFSSRPAIIGNFIDLPEYFDTMDCNLRHSEAYSANTAFTTSRQSRKDLELHWKAPSEDFDSIEFKATIIRGKYYWTHIKSPPLFFNHFPPSVAECGTKISCLQYSVDPYGCDEGLCDYIVVSEVHGNYVHFHIGGKVRGMGYVGIGFTTDKEKLSFLDIYVCMKHESGFVDAAHYTYDKTHVNMQKSIKLDNIIYDKDGDYIWCKFTRPLRYQTTTSAVDLSKEAYQAIVWGTLDFVEMEPILQDETKILQHLKPWHRNRSLNVIQTSHGIISRSSTWMILFTIFTTSLLVLN